MRLFCKPCECSFQERFCNVYLLLQTDLTITSSQKQSAFVTSHLGSHYPRNKQDKKKFTTATTRPILLLHYKQVKTIIKVKAAEEKKPFKTAKGNNAIHKGLLLKYIHALLKYWPYASEWYIHYVNIYPESKFKALRLSKWAQIPHLNETESLRLETEQPALKIWI